MSSNLSNDTDISRLVHLFHCSTSDVSIKTTIVFSAVRVLFVLPLSIFILHLGHQRWRRQRSFKTASHADIFTYHMVAMELFYALGLFFFVCGLLLNVVNISYAGYYFSFIVFYGEGFFHILTCVERYLAVVHPITYLRLKNKRGILIRNVSIGCVWLLSFGSCGVTYLYLAKQPTAPVLIVPFLAMIVTSFCNVSVLCVLVRPRPGGGGGETVRAKQMKLRAFYTITAIMGVLFLWFVGFLISITVGKMKLLNGEVSCIVSSAVSCFNLPSSLVLPLLFLQREGRLSCCSHASEKYRVSKKIQKRIE